MENKKFKPYWVICTQSYDYEGIEIPKGRMSLHGSIRPIVSNRWRKASDFEITNMKSHRGNNYFL